MQSGRGTHAYTEEEIVAVHQIVNSSMPYDPWPEVCVGQTVRVTHGTLRGLEGVVVQLKKDCRLVISVTLLQHHVSIHIDRDSVVPVNRVALVA